MSASVPAPEARLRGIAARAAEAASILDAGREPLADSGYGYEHMGDMARDLDTLAREDVPWLLALLERSLAQTEQMREALRDLLDNLGGHDHWREGGAGGTCETCGRQSAAASRARAALAAAVPTVAAEIELCDVLCAACHRRHHNRARSN